MFKDTKEGQTHFYGDNCGEPEHNPLSNKSVEEIVETVFQAVMADIGKHYRASDKLSDIIIDSLSDHLTKALLSERKQTIEDIEQKAKKFLLDNF